MQLSDWTNLIRTMAPDEAERLAAGDYEEALGLAVIRYSTDRPLVEAEDVMTEDGYTVPLPSLWIADFSRVAGIELPGHVPPLMLPRDGWMPHRIPGRDVLLLVAPQGIGETLRLHFTLPHEVSEGKDTIPAKDREAVCHWAAGLILDKLSGLHAGDRQSTIASDSVDHVQKMPNYKTLAETQRKQYWDHLGIDPKRTVAAGTVVLVGANKLLHTGPRPRRRR